MPCNHRQAIKADYCLNQINNVTRVVERPMELCNVYIPISRHSQWGEPWLGGLILILLLRLKQLDLLHVHGLLPLDVE